MITKLGLAATLLTLLAFAGCDDPSKVDHPEIYYGLPVGATNFKDLGNDWHSFDLPCDGGKRSFMHKRLWGEAGVECITEISPR